MALSSHFALDIVYKVHGMVSRGATAETPKIVLCGLASACLKEWNAGERLPHAQPHCVCGNGIMAVGQEVRRLGQKWTKGRDWVQVHPGDDHGLA